LRGHALKNPTKKLLAWQEFHFPSAAPTICSSKIRRQMAGPFSYQYNNFLIDGVGMHSKPDEKLLAWQEFHFPSVAPTIYSSKIRRQMATPLSLK
jgi:hypothetical protein